MKKLSLLLLVVVFLTSCELSPGPMQNLGTDGGPCDDFSSWKEIPTPFEGERCFEFLDGHAGGVVCKRTDSVFLKACADPKRRPDQKSPEPPAPIAP